MLRRTSYAAQFKPDKDRFDPSHRREHCAVNLNQIHMIGRDLGQQIRIERPTASGTTLALYTIIDTHEENSDAVFVGYTNLDLRKRLGLSKHILSRAILMLRSQPLVLLFLRQDTTVNLLNSWMTTAIITD